MTMRTVLRASLTLTSWARRVLALVVIVALALPAMIIVFGAWWTSYAFGVAAILSAAWRSAAKSDAAQTELERRRAEWENHQTWVP